MEESSSRELVLFDPEIERTLHTLRRQYRSQMTNNAEEMNMEEETAMNERPKKLRNCHTSSTEGYGPSIMRPPVNANHFELKPVMIMMIQNMVQFFGFTHEDPNQHIANFLEY